MNFIRKYKLLIVVYTAALIVGVLEIMRPAAEEKGIRDTASLPSYSQTQLDVWPDSLESHVLRSIEARYLRFDLDESLEHLKRGLATGIISDERVFYDHLVVLGRMRADPARIDRAADLWLRHFPNSDNEDPRAQEIEEFPPPMVAGSRWRGAISPDGKTYALPYAPNQIQFWDSVTGAQRLVSAGELKPQVMLRFSPDAGTLAAVGNGSAVILVDVASGTQKEMLRGPESKVYSVSFTSDGMTCATGSADGAIRLWDSATGDHRATHKGHQRPVSALVFSDDGQTLVSGDWGGTVTIRDSWTILHSIKAHDAVISDLAISPDGKTVATASRDNTVKLWSVAGGELQQTMVGHEAPVCCVVFSPVGNIVASGGADLTVKLWNARTGQLAHTLQTRADPFEIIFAVDNAHILIACADQTLLQAAVVSSAP